MKEKTADLAKGRWQSILATLGVEEEFLRKGKNCPCPRCGGKDRYEFTDKYGNGEWVCRKCTGKYENGFTLLDARFGWDFKEAAKRVDEVLPTATETPKTAKPDPRKRLRDVARRLTPASDAVAKYLASRGLEVPPGIKQGRLRYWHGKQDLGVFDCMVGLVMNGNRAATYHVTYLGDGCKADVPTARKVLPPVISMNGGAVRLYPEAEVMGVAEGIETAIAASMLHKMPVWAALNANNMEKFNPPEACKRLVIFGDNDDNFTGHRSAYVLANRLALKGLDVEVRLPKKGDWNDEVAK